MSVVSIPHSRWNVALLLGQPKMSLLHLFLLHAFSTVCLCSNFQHLYCFLRFILFYNVCVCVRVQRPEEGVKLPRARVIYTVVSHLSEVLRTKLRSSTRAASTFNHGAHLSPETTLDSLYKGLRLSPSLNSHIKKKNKKKPGVLRKLRQEDSEFQVTLS